MKFDKSSSIAVVFATVVVLHFLSVAGQAEMPALHPWNLSEKDYDLGLSRDYNLKECAWSRPEYIWQTKELAKDLPNWGKRTRSGELAWRAAEVVSVNSDGTANSKAEFALDSKEGVGKGPRVTFRWSQNPAEIRLVPRAHVVVALDRAGQAHGVVISGTLKFCRPVTGNVNAIFDASWYKETGNQKRELLLAPLQLLATRIDSVGYHDYVFFDETGALDVLTCDMWDGAWNGHGGGASSAIEEEMPRVDLRKIRVATTSAREKFLAEKPHKSLTPVLQDKEWRSTAEAKATIVYKPQ